MDFVVGVAFAGAAVERLALPEVELADVAAHLGDGGGAHGEFSQAGADEGGNGEVVSRQFAAELEFLPVFAIEAPKFYLSFCLTASRSAFCSSVIMLNWTGFPSLRLVGI